MVTLTDENKERMTKVIAMTPYMVHLGMELVDQLDAAQWPGRRR